MKSFYKIIHTSSRTSWGNREKRILAESLWMKENGHQVAVVTPAGSPLFEKAKQNGVMVYPISFKPLARIGEYGRLKEIFISEQPFVVNAHGKRDAKLALKAAQTTEVPLRIMSRHDGERVKHTWPNKKLYKTRCHYVFTTSKDSADHLKQTFALSDMHIFSIPDGIELPTELPDKTACKKQLARKLGREFPPNTRFIGVFGEIDTHAMASLLKTAQNINGRFSDHHLVTTAASWSPQKTNESEQDALSNRIHVLPSTADALTGLCPGFDCAVFFCENQTFYQGVPGELTRAMVQGCPVITPDAKGLRDVIEDNKTGLVFDFSQPEDLFKKIAATLDHPEETQARVQAAQHLIKKHYTMDAMGRDVIRIYRLHQVKIERRFSGVS